MFTPLFAKVESRNKIRACNQGQHCTDVATSIIQLPSLTTVAKLAHKLEALSNGFDSDIFVHLFHFSPTVPIIGVLRAVEDGRKIRTYSLGAPPLLPQQRTPFEPDACTQ